MNNRPIGVFDSGLGGLTAVRELKKLMPCEDIIFFADRGRNPYGGRSREQLIRYSLDDVAFVKSMGVKAVFSACGTISSIAGEIIAESCDCPYGGVVIPSAEAAVNATKNKKIGVICTKATYDTKGYTKAIKALMPDAEVTEKYCPIFVPLIEEGFTDKDNKIMKLAVEHYLLEMKEAGIDTLILGCTHYPIIEAFIADYMGDVVLIDSGAEGARAMERLLKSENMCAGERKGQLICYVSAGPEGFKTFADNYLGEGAVDSVKTVVVGQPEEICLHK